MTFIHAHQLNIMLVFTGVNAAMVVMLFFTKALTARRRSVFILLESALFFLVLFDRLAYIYSGNLSRNGRVMVRVSNFIVFFITPAIVYLFNMYLWDLLTDEGQMRAIPTRLKVSGVMAILGMILSVIAAFTGLYYVFDEYNHYHRASGFIISYIFPVVAPMLQLSVIYQYRKLFGKLIYSSLVLFIVAPITASIIQIFAYGLSLTNITLATTGMFLYIFAYLNINEEIERAHKTEIDFLRDEQKSIRRLFDQTVTSFVNAMDGRYIHLQGHSQRVAQFARKIAELDGKNSSECDEIYYAALLHDVGRIWLPDSIVKNLGNLTEDEVDKVRQMPVIGSQILSNIHDLPDIGIGAHYHCERFDGKGYPDGLSGEDIPETARIIAAADAYDLLASESDLKPPMPEQLIREEFVKESGAQLDPKYAKIVLSVMDSQDMDSTSDPVMASSAVWENEFYCGDYRDHVTSGIIVTEEPVKINLKFTPTKEDENSFSVPALILFDSFDGRIHDIPNEIEAYRYSEFGEVWFDGHYVCTAARNMEMTSEEKQSSADSGSEDCETVSYEITAYRQKDHIRIVVDSEDYSRSVTVALPDSSLFAYIGLTGEHCHISDVTIEKLEASHEVEEIVRIAEPVSYIERLESDIPNIQIDGRRSDSTVGVLVEDGLRIDFHTMSLPSANLIWHCPYIVLFTSEDGTVGGEGYTEYALIRLNGETKKTDEISQNVINVERSDDFISWDNWKEQNHKGYECELIFKRMGNKITIHTENAGIIIDNVTTILSQKNTVYVALTGDQCAITDIRIRKSNSGK